MDDKEKDFDTLGKNWLMDSQDFSPGFEEVEVLDKVGNRTYLILVIYDIVENKRRAKIAKKLLGFGERVQLSAFECHLTNRQYENMINTVVPMIDETTDLLRVYKLSGRSEIKVWGHIPETYDEEVVIL